MTAVAERSGIRSLDELWRFPHLFRSAYRQCLDAERLALVHCEAQKLERVYQADIERFLAFLDTPLSRLRANEMRCAPGHGFARVGLDRDQETNSIQAQAR